MRLLRFALPLLTVLLVGCGSPSPGKSADADGPGKSAGIPEPPDIFAQLGFPRTPLPVRWLEAGAAGSGTREYWEGIVDYKGEHLDVAVRGFLVITDDPQTGDKQYEMTELHIKNQGSGPLTLADTVKSSGRVSVERLVAEPAPLTVYRLDGGGAPERARVFVRFDDQLSVPSGQALEKTTRNAASTLTLLGTATPQRLEVTAAAQPLLNHKIGLHVGDELLTRLDRLTSFAPYTLKSSSVGTQLRAESTLTGEEAPAREPDHTIQVFKFKAIARGWIDLEFEHGGSGQTFRVKVE